MLVPPRNVDRLVWNSRLTAFVHDFAAGVQITLTRSRNNSRPVNLCAQPEGNQNGNKFNA